MVRWYKVAFAVLALAAGAGLIGLLGRSATPAYAFAQTIDAVKDIRYFHFQLQATPDKTDREAWIEYDPNDGSPRVRVNFYAIKATMVWDRGITQYWRWDSKELCIYEDKEYTDRIWHFVRRYDPRQAIPYLQERARQEGIQIDIHQPEKDIDPIIVAVAYEPNTFLVGSRQPRMREEFHIDPATKLITRVEAEAFVEGRFISRGAWEYVDYNRPFDPGIFDLRREAPPDVNVSDTTGILMGVEKGQLSDEEIAVRTVREFLDAWVAKDYDRAIQIHGYAEIAQTKSIRENLLLKKDIRRVISVGLPVLPERPMGGLVVPCEVECEENGQVKVESLAFHTSEGSRGRWRIRDPQVMK